MKNPNASTVIHRCALIGGGVISSYYQKGLRISPQLQLCALCDINEDCYSRSYYNDYPFYSNISDLIDTEDFSIAIISTGVDSHAELASLLLEHDKDLMIEKPLVLDMETLECLYEKARSLDRKIYAMMHWKCANEVRYLSKHINEYGPISEIHISINDNYAAADGITIQEDRRALGGAWFDSGINALSFLSTVIDISDLIITGTQSIVDPTSNQDVYVLKECRAKNCPRVIIEIDWTKQSRAKQTILNTHSGTIHVQHDQERILLNDSILFESNTDNRLESHYCNLFSEDIFKQDFGNVIQIYEALFK